MDITEIENPENAGHWDPHSLKMRLLIRFERHKWCPQPTKNEKSADVGIKPK